MEYSCEWSRAGGNLPGSTRLIYRFLPNRISTVIFTIAIVMMLTVKMRIIDSTSFQVRGFRIARDLIPGFSVGAPVAPLETRPIRNTELNIW
jgi:hypothetical protein